MCLCGQVRSDGRGFTHVFFVIPGRIVQAQRKKKFLTKGTFAHVHLPLTALWPVIQHLAQQDVLPQIQVGDCNPKTRAGIVHNKSC
jgi:hypothetical protein